MFLWFGNKTKLETVPGGRKVIADCPGCGATCKFHECRQEKTFSAYVVVPLWKREKTVFRCTNCGDVFEMADDDGEVGFDEAELDAALAEQRAQQDRKAELERERLQQVARQREQEELRRRAEARRKQEAEQRRRAAAARERQLDDDLAALKRKMGLE